MWTLEKQELVTKCDELRRNDPVATTLDLGAYGKVEWEDAVEIAACLKKNTHLREILVLLGKSNTNVDNSTCSYHLAPDAALALAHFLRNSPSLEALTIRNASNDNDNDHDNDNDENEKKNTFNTSILLDSISHRRSLTKLTLQEVHVERPSLLETVLATTRTLTHLDLHYRTRPKHLTLLVAQALRRGLTQNTTLTEFKLHSRQAAFTEEIVAGLLEHAQLLVLDLDVPVTDTSAQVLRCLLHSNKTLRVLNLTPRRAATRTVRATTVTHHGNRKHLQQEEQEDDVLNKSSSEITVMSSSHGHLTDAAADAANAGNSVNANHANVPALRPILEGLANNKGLKDVRLHVSDPAAACAAAWTEMLEKNKSMVRLELFRMDDNDDDDDDNNIDSDHVSHGQQQPTIQYSKLGLQSTTAIAKGLGKNSTLQSLHFSGNLLAGAFHGPTWQDTLQRNHTLKELGLSGCNIGNDGVLFLAQGMSRNKSIQALDLTGNAIGNTGITTLTRALTSNKTLESLSMAQNLLAGPQGGYAVNELLKSNNVLKRLDLRNNMIGRDGGAGLLAEGLSQNKTLETLDLENNTLDSASFLAICDSLHGGGLRVLVAENNDLFSNDCDRALKEMLGSKALRSHDEGGKNRSRSIGMSGGKALTKLLSKFSREILMTILVLVAVLIAWIDRSGYYVRVSWLEPSDSFLNESDFTQDSELLIIADDW